MLWGKAKWTAPWGQPLATTPGTGGCRRDTCQAPGIQPGLQQAFLPGGVDYCPGHSLPGFLRMGEGLIGNPEFGTLTERIRRMDSWSTCDTERSGGETDFGWGTLVHWPPWAVYGHLGPSSVTSPGLEPLQVADRG